MANPPLSPQQFGLAHQQHNMELNQGGEGYWQSHSYEVKNFGGRQHRVRTLTNPPEADEQPAA